MFRIVARDLSAGNEARDVYVGIYASSVENVLDRFLEAPGCRWMRHSYLLLIEDGRGVRQRVRFSKD
jgi:hypothetical protein